MLLLYQEDKFRCAICIRPDMYSRAKYILLVQYSEQSRSAIRPCCRQPMCSGEVGAWVPSQDHSNQDGNWWIAVETATWHRLCRTAICQTVFDPTASHHKLIGFPVRHMRRQSGIGIEFTMKNLPSFGKKGGHFLSSILWYVSASIATSLLGGTLVHCMARSSTQWVPRNRMPGNVLHSLQFR